MILQHYSLAPSQTNYIFQSFGFQPPPVIDILAIPPLNEMGDKALREDFGDKPSMPAFRILTERKEEKHNLEKLHFFIRENSLNSKCL